MSWLEKKCLFTSAGTHLFLLLLLVLGSAFFVSDRPHSLPSVRVVPSRLVDEALSGGGGNPNQPPTDAQQKGQILAPTPAKPVEAVLKPEPVRQPPEPKADIKKVEPRSAPKKEVAKVSKEPAKPAPTPKSATAKQTPLDLKPIVRNQSAAMKAKAEAETRELALANKHAASQLNKAIEDLRSGFASGTVVEVSGTGGEAYANYAQWVKTVYDEAWLVTDDLTDDTSTAKVSVTIARNGDVVEAKMVVPSGNAALDKSVERALKSVRFVAPFPAGARESQRTFIIKFNLKSKRLAG